MFKNALLLLCLLCAIGGTSLTATSARAAGFYVSGKTLKDANGNTFVPRGISNPNIWFDTQAYNVLPNVAARHTNIIRVVWTTAGSASRLDQILSADEANDMVSMVELHDGTGSNDTTLLNNMAYYYARSDVLEVLKKHERYLLINIANEWSNNISDATWAAAYKTPISILRNAGLTTSLVIDGEGYGQSASSGLNYGQELENYDPRHNILFSIHMYVVWNNAQDIYNAMYNFHQANLPLVIGEFGYDYNNGNNNLGCTVNAPLLMQYAQQFGVGYIAWSTEGNDSADAWLDLMTGWSSTTAWGNTVWYNTNGIYNTAKTASVFKSSGASSASSQTIANGTYKIANRNNGGSTTAWKVLEAYGADTADGSVIDQYSYNGGATQMWNVTYQGNGEYSIVNVNAYRDLDVTNSGGSGTFAELWDSNNGSNQRWVITATDNGWYRVSPAYNTDLALDVYNAYTGNYAPGNSNGRIDVYTWSGNYNQQWAFWAP